jgi:hypothetical protein
MTKRIRKQLVWVVKNFRGNNSFEKKKPAFHVLATAY